MASSTSPSTTSSDNDDNDNDTDIDTENTEWEKLLPVDIACSNNKNPTREEICILCNAIPHPTFHFSPTMLHGIACTNAYIQQDRCAVWK